MAEISAGVDIDDCCRISAADFMQIPQGAANREGRAAGGRGERAAGPAARSAAVSGRSPLKPSVGRFGLRPEPRRAL